MKNKISLDAIVDYILEHEQFAEDFETHFGFSAAELEDHLDMIPSPIVEIDVAKDSDWKKNNGPAKLNDNADIENFIKDKYGNNIDYWEIKHTPTSIIMVVKYDSDGTQFRVSLSDSRLQKKSNSKTGR